MSSPRWHQLSGKTKHGALYSSYTLYWCSFKLQSTDDFFKSPSYKFFQAWNYTKYKCSKGLCCQNKPNWMLHMQRPRAEVLCVPTKHIMVINWDEEYKSMSEGQLEALQRVAQHQQVNKAKDVHVFCENDSSPALLVSKILILEQQDDNDIRCHVFHTKAGTNGRTTKVIIDGGSCHSLASEELCSKLYFEYKCRPQPDKL